MATVVFGDCVYSLRCKTLETVTVRIMAPSLLDRYYRRYSSICFCNVLLKIVLDSVFGILVEQALYSLSRGFAMGFFKRSQKRILRVISNAKLVNMANLSLF